MNDFDKTLREVDRSGLSSAAVGTIQVNLGLLCNLSCRHCHVEATPKRREIMTWETMQSVLKLAKALPGARVDLTGGAPELNPNFRALVDALLDQGHQVQVRTNLTVYFEAGQGDTPEFLADRGVHLVASLPCYLDDNVDKQRGSGVYKRSVTALRRLNSLGYGRQETLPLNLVYNPGGAFLPPAQATLEGAYRRELRELCLENGLQPPPGIPSMSPSTTDTGRAVLLNIILISRGPIPGKREATRAAAPPGSMSGPPETVSITISSPLCTVRAGACVASKYPQCTVSGEALRTVLMPALPTTALRPGPPSRSSRPA